MVRTIEGSMNADGIRFAIVASRFNGLIVEKLLAGATDTLQRHGAKTDDITVVRVPGSFELPAVARKLAASGKHDAVVCLGALLKGETPHFDYISSTVTAEIAAAGRESGVPVIYGVLTCDTTEQALNRAGLKMGNKGSEAAVAAIEVVQVLRQI